MSKNTLRLVHNADGPIAADAMDRSGESSGRRPSTGYPLADEHLDFVDRTGTYADHYDPQFVVGMLLLLTSMVRGLEQKDAKAMLRRATRLKDLHGRFVQHRRGYVVFQPNDGPELMLQQDMMHAYDTSLW